VNFSFIVQFVNVNGRRIEEIEMYLLRRLAYLLMCIANVPVVVEELHIKTQLDFTKSNQN
jgi:hypothetical protein